MECMEAAMKRIPAAQCGGRAGSARCDADEQGGHHGGLRDIMQGMIFIRQHMESCLILWWNCFMRENRSI